MASGPSAPRTARATRCLDTPRRSLTSDSPRGASSSGTGRVALFESGEVRSPAAGSLPAGLDSLAAVQAMFPVTSRDEMRGERGEVDLFGQPNELGEVFESDFAGIWGALTDRLLAHPDYRALFARAYPDVAIEQLGFEHAANAIAAFEVTRLYPHGQPLQSLPVR